MTHVHCCDVVQPPHDCESVEREIERLSSLLRPSMSGAVAATLLLDVTPERLANAMAVEGYADPDPIEQWAAPVEAARRILARLVPLETE